MLAFPCLSECIIERIYTVVQNIGKAHEYRQGQPLCLNLMGQSIHVDAIVYSIGGRAHNQMAGIIDIKILSAPVMNIVMGARCFYGPIGHGHYFCQQIFGL